MSTARHLISLLRTHVQGDENEFLSVAMEVAAREARLGHAKVAEQIRDLVDQARARNSQIEKRPGSVVVLQPKGEIANLLSVQQLRSDSRVWFFQMRLKNVCEERFWSRDSRPNCGIITFERGENFSS